MIRFCKSFALFWNLLFWIFVFQGISKLSNFKIINFKHQGLQLLYLLRQKRERYGKVQETLLTLNFVKYPCILQQITCAELSFVLKGPL